MAPQSGATRLRCAAVVAARSSTRPAQVVTSPGTALSDVTFVVVDLVTTGQSAAGDAITEVGAVKLRGGECLGTFSTLVNPGQEIPPFITYLTGITQAMVLPAPRIEAVLPTLVEFVGDAVVVGHNVRFDLGFLNAALARHGHSRLSNPAVDTCALARRLARDEVPNCKLSTLAEHFRLANRPSHRALADALATGELLHRLIERASGFGVNGLDELVALPTVKGHPQLAKLALTADLPRAPGVYLFRNAAGRVLYVGRAVDLRRRVRSYFTGDERRKIGPLLREMAAVDHVVCGGGELEAAVLEVRLIHALSPPYNSQIKSWRRYAYVKLTLDEAFPRLAVVRAPRAGDGCLYLGPLPSVGTARLVAEALETALPLRRCTRPVPRRALPAPCAPAQLGVATCPCAGGIGQDDYRVLVARVVRGLTEEPAALLEPLWDRMARLAAARRYEEAAATRDRAGALARALARQRRLDGLRRAGTVEVELPGGTGATLEGGCLAAVRGAAGTGPSSPEGADASSPPSSRDVRRPGPPLPASEPLPAHLADEVSAVASYLEARAGSLRLVACEGEWASSLPRLPRFEPREGEATG